MVLKVVPCYKPWSENVQYSSPVCFVHQYSTVILALLCSVFATINITFTAVQYSMFYLKILEIILKGKACALIESYLRKA